MKKNNQLEDHLSLSTALGATVLVAMIIGLAVGIGVMMNNARYRRVLTQYTSETHALLADQEPKVIELFTTVMDSCGGASATESAKLRDNDNCQEAKDHLAALGVDRLRDSSSIAYVRARDDSFEVLEASGKYSSPRKLHTNGSNHFRYDKADVLATLFYEEDAVPMWDDYIWFISGKEVVVPIVIDGQTYGYIFRGVIE